MTQPGLEGYKKLRILKWQFGIVGRVKRGLNRSVQIKRSVPIFHQIRIRRSANIFVQIRNHNHIRKTEVRKFKVKLVNMNAIVNFAQIEKKATCLMTF